jgi:uncharacterized protein (DUF362 family)
VKTMGKHIITSRRLFLRHALSFGATVFTQWLTACNRNPLTFVEPTQQLNVTRSIMASPTPHLTDTPPAHTSTPKPSPTPSPIPDGALFDENQLSQVYVAYDPDHSRYPDTPPFHPDTLYPEYPFTKDALGPQNDTYRLVRQALKLLFPQGYGEPGWNPLQHVIRPGDRVLIKPNLVDASTWQNGQMTHPSILRPILDYVYKACGPQGHIVVGDAPWAVDVFAPLVRQTGIETLTDWLVQQAGVPVALIDLNTSDPQDTPLVNLGHYSEFSGVQRTWFDGHGRPMVVEGEPGVGRYRISRFVFDADVVISVPKAKVHCSGGITVAMKNAIGIIPAWDGPYNDGYLKDCAHTSDIDQAAGDRGMYLDNDTIWRTMADLNRIIRYTDEKGVLQSTPQRRLLHIVDAIVAAEASQYNPIPYPLNTVIISSDPIAVDAITARCMGFDAQMLKSVQNPAFRTELPLGYSHPAQIKVHTTGKGLSQIYRQVLQPELQIYSWQGHLEANDFDSPEIVTCTVSPDGKLEVHMRDDSPVSWGRVDYEYAGRHLIKALEFVRGDYTDGIWETAFPHGAYTPRINVSASDALFNETSITFDL